MRVFKSKIIREQLTEQEISELISDFISYKLKGIVPNNFGRNELYDHPHSLPIIKAEEVRHIHLIDSKRTWPVYTLQFHKTSDEHLIYCQGYSDPGCYLLMTILAPEAHELARNNNVMYNIGRMAEKFRYQY